MELHCCRYTYFNFEIYVIACFINGLNNHWPYASITFSRFFLALACPTLYFPYISTFKGFIFLCSIIHEPSFEFPVLSFLCLEDFHIQPIIKSAILSRGSRRKKNLKCVRYNVNGESRSFLLLLIIKPRKKGYTMIIIDLGKNTILIILLKLWF